MNHSKKPQPQGKGQGQEKSPSFPVNEPDTLLSFLLKTYSHMGRNSVKSMLTHGQVSVNGRSVTRHDHPLLPGQTVAVNRTKEPERPPLTGLTILHEDEDFIIIQKQAGLLSIASPQEKELTAYRQLSDYVKAENPKNRIYVVHRLDRDTSGVMMFAKNERFQQAIQEAWQDAVEERTYIALVEGHVSKPEGTITSWLKESKTLRMYSSKVPNDGQHAVTHYKVIQSNREFSLLEVQLETGRKNQIRVHMQDMGHPIAGDKKYGAQTNAIGRLGLHAKTLTFTHPLKPGPVLRFQSDTPGIFLRPFRTEKP